jgi:hypothetical protein
MNLLRGLAPTRSVGSRHYRQKLREIEARLGAAIAPSP